MEQQRENELRLLEETVNDNCVQHLETITIQVQEIRSKKMEGIAI